MESRLPHDLNIEKSGWQRARERSVSSLRAYVLNNLAAELREDYEQHVKPAIEVETADGVAVHKAMRPRDKFRWYSSLRCTAQELVCSRAAPSPDERQPTTWSRWHGPSTRRIGTAYCTAI